VVAFGMLGLGANLRVHVVDSADNEMIRTYSPRDLMARWKGIGRKPWYGVVV
jgi:hypothetical protein